MRKKLGPVLIVVGILLLLLATFLREYSPTAVGLIAVIGIFALMIGPILAYVYRDKPIKSESTLIQDKVPEKRTFGSVLSFLGVVILIGPIAIALLSSALSGLLNCTGYADALTSCSVGGETVAKILYSGIMLHWALYFTFIPGLVLIFVGGAIHKSLLKSN